MSDEDDDLFADSGGDTDDLIAESKAKPAAKPKKLKKKGAAAKKRKRDIPDADNDSDDDGPGLFDSDDDEPTAKKASKPLSKRERMEALRAKKRQEKGSNLPGEKSKKGDGYGSEDSYDSAEYVRTKEDMDFIDTEGDDADAVAELYAEQTFDDERGEADEEPKKKNKIKGAGSNRGRSERAELEAEADEDNPIMQAVNKMKRKKRSQKKLSELEDEAKPFLARMEQAADEDEEAFAQKRPAVKKLVMLNEVADTLARRDMFRSLLDLDLLAICKRWIQPLPSGTLGNLTVRQRIIASITLMTGENGITAGDLKRSEFGKVIMTLYMHKSETPAMKRQMKSLIEQWSRPIFQKSGNMRDLERVHHSRGCGVALSFGIGTKQNSDAIQFLWPAAAPLFQAAARTWNISMSPTPEVEQTPPPPPRPVQQALQWQRIAKQPNSILEDDETTMNNVKYEEMLVHPILFAHPKPKLVAIYSSQPAGLVEQVRKHSTVDRIMVFTDTADASCVDESQRLGNGMPLIAWVTNGNVPSETKFDVAIIDQAFSPSMPPALWYHHLDGNGTLVEHLMDDPARRFNQTNQLVEAGFERVIDYDTHNANNNKICRFAVAFKSDKMRARWHLNEAHWNCLMHGRVRVENAVGDNLPVLPFRYFDSSTMTSIEFPSKPSALEYCRLRPEAKACVEGHGWDPDIYDVPIETIKVAKSGMGEHSGRGLFATADIPSNSYVGLESSTSAVKLPWKAFQMIYEMYENEIFEDDTIFLYYYFEGYGFVEEPFGEPEFTVDATILTFANHGCNGTFNTGTPSDIHELNADPEHVPVEYGYLDREKYNPMEQRDLFKDAVLTMTSKDIQVGEELLDNYLAFGGAVYFKESVESLRAQCAGVALGEVERYQNKLFDHENTTSTETI